MSASASSDLSDRIEAVKKRIEGAARRAGRDPNEIRTIAVSKTFPPERVLEARERRRVRPIDRKIRLPEERVGAPHVAAPG